VKKFTCQKRRFFSERVNEEKMVSQKENLVYQKKKNLFVKRIKKEKR